MLLGMPLHVRGARLARGPALGIVIRDHRGLNGVGEVGEPLIKMRALGRPELRRKPRLGMAIDQVQADRRGLIDHEIAIDKRRDAAVGVELQVLGRLVLLLVAVEQNQLVFCPDLLQHHMRRQVGVSGVVVEFVHGRVSPFLRASSV